MLSEPMPASDGSVSRGFKNDGKSRERFVRRLGSHRHSGGQRSGFENRVAAEGWWHKDDGRVSIGHGDRFSYGVENRHGIVAMLDELAALTWCDAGDNVRAVFQHLAGVELAFAPGDALHEYFGVLVN